MRAKRELYGNDQFGNTWGPLNPKAPKKSLLEATFRRSAVPMYVDTKDGKARKVGYVVSPERGEQEYALWVDLYWRTTERWC